MIGSGIMSAESEAGGHEDRVKAFGLKHRTGLVTLVFTDLVGSTQLKQRLGDWLGVRRIQEHHDTVRRVLAGFPEAAEISTAGDSFFLVFARPSDAVLFALSLQKTLREAARADEAPLRDRIGIHLGEVVIEKSGQRGVHDLYGIQVDLCARLMSLASADQILVSSLVFGSSREAVARGAEGLGPVRWERHGRYALKGIDQPVEVHEVGESGVAPFWKPAGELVEEVARPATQVSGPEAASPVTPPRRARPMPWAALGVGLGLMVLAGLLGWRWLSPRTERLAILPFHSPEAGARADDFGIGLAERVEARLQERVVDSRTLRFSPLRDAVENGVTNARLAGSKLAADLVVEGSLSGALNRRHLSVVLQGRAPNGAFVERRSGDFTQNPEETLAQFEERLAQHLSEWLGASRSKGAAPGGSGVPAVSEAPPPPVDPQVAELHLEGLGALRNRHVKGSLEKAVRDLRLAHTQRPDDRDICADYAEALFWTFDQTQDPEDLILAQTVAERNATREPSSERASAVLGLILTLSERPAEAVPHLRRALELRRSNSRARVDLARALGQMGKADEASAEFDRAIALDPSDWYAFNARGLHQMSYGRLEIAERDLQRVVQLAPSNYQGPLNAGVIALQRGDVIKARTLFHRALTMAPQRGYSGAMHAMLGISWLANDLERAIRELDQAAIEAPNDVACAINLADALMREKAASSRSKARSEYERGLRIVDKKIQRLERYGASSLTDRINRVRCLSGLGQMVPATVSIDQILREHPNNQEVILVAGIVYELSGYRDKALAVLRRGLQLGITVERMRMEWALDNVLGEFAGPSRTVTKKP